MIETSPPRATLRYDEVDGHGVTLPVVEVRAVKAGPTVAVGANMHGDEATGLGIVHSLCRSLPDALSCGTVLLYPSLNPKGLEAQSRRMPSDELDPNRAYPGSPTGTPAERLAFRVWRDLEKRGTELYLDLHTDSPSAIPYAIVDRVFQGPERTRLAARCEELAAASGFTVLREYPTERYVRFALQRSLPGALVNQRSIPSLTLEVGPRRCIDPEAVGEGVAAAYGVLTAAGLCARPAPAHPSRISGGPWRREGGPRTTRNGVLVPKLPVGSAFERGSLLAEVRSLDGRVRESLIARFAGFVVAWPERAWVAVGTTSGTLGLKDEAR